MQADAPTFAYDPAGHTEHSETEVAPDTDEALPAVHKEHDEDALMLE